MTESSLETRKLLRKITDTCIRPEPTEKEKERIIEDMINEDHMIYDILAEI